MSSQADIVEALVECSNKINLPIWLSISCVFDKNKKINLGYDDDINKDKPKIYENLEESLSLMEKDMKKFNQRNNGELKKKFETPYALDQNWYPLQKKSRWYLLRHGNIKCRL